MGDNAIDNEVVDPHLTTKIVRSYVQHHIVGTGQLSELIISVHRALAQLGQPVQPEEVRTPAVSVRQSVRPDYVVCLDCGYRGKTLRRHINSRHGLSRDENLRRWGLHSDHLLTAPAYSEHRSTLASNLAWVESQRQRRLRNPRQGNSGRQPQTGGRGGIESETDQPL